MSCGWLRPTFSVADVYSPELGRVFLRLGFQFSQCWLCFSAHSGHRVCPSIGLFGQLTQRPWSFLALATFGGAF